MRFLDGHAPNHDLTYDDVFVVPNRSAVADGGFPAHRPVPGSARLPGTVLSFGDSGADPPRGYFLPWFLTASMAAAAASGSR